MRTALFSQAVKFCYSFVAVLAVSLTISDPVQGGDGANDEPGVWEFMARWSRAYGSMSAKASAVRETPELEIIDRFGHLISAEGPAFNQNL